MLSQMTHSMTHLLGRSKTAPVSLRRYQHKGPSSDLLNRVKSGGRYVYLLRTPTICWQECWCQQIDSRLGFLCWSITLTQPSLVGMEVADEDLPGLYAWV